MKKLIIAGLATLAIAAPAQGQILYCKNLSSEFVVISPAQAWVLNAFRINKKFVGQCSGDKQGDVHPYVYRKDLN